MIGGVQMIEKCSKCGYAFDSEKHHEKCGLEDE